MEKSHGTTYELPAPVSRGAAKRSSLRFVSYVLLPIIIFLIFFKHSIFESMNNRSHHADILTKSQCKQPDALFPSSDNDRLEQMFDFLSTANFKEGSIARLSGAVQIPTESFDDLGPIGEDSRWEIMYKFADYLKHTFPHVHEYLEPEVVNTHGLIFTYKGSDDSLKPMLFLAHQDVVPVPNATVEAWTHPPWSGHFDGKSVWGRGSVDCKNQLIAVLETMELFIEAGFKPKRTIVMSFGFDEEVSGPQGAGHLAPVLLERYGKDGIAALIDEGAYFAKSWGSTFAGPGVAEKGNTDVHITIRMPGGHSSIPVDHTSIGVMSELITKIEAEQYTTYLADENPYLAQMQCGAAHSPDFPKKLRKLLGRHSTHTCKAKPDLLALEAAKQGRNIQYLMQTSQAVDLIDGGVKSNALPERTTATVNHRINIGDEPEDVWKRITSLAKPIAKKYGLKLHAFDGVEEEALSISIYPSKTTLRAAPITPTIVDRNSPYAILAGTTRALYGQDVIVTPSMMTGNTDTRYYWDLTKHIFRFGPAYDPELSGGLGNIHTVDEHASISGHIDMVKWFTLFVRNLDEAILED